MDNEGYIENQFTIKKKKTKLTNNSTTSFIITFGLQGINWWNDTYTQYTLHTPSAQTGLLQKMWTKYNRQDTGKTFFNVDYLLKMH